MIDLPKQLKEKGINFVLIQKKEKRPFQHEWQNKVIEYDNPELLIHISNGGNYGVRGGGSKNLVIVDFDNKEVQEKALPLLPNTFQVKTGKGLLHLYYQTDMAPESFKGFDEQMNTLFDVQGIGKQVVGPNSIHPNGNIYQVFNDSPINFISYAELKAILTPFNKKQSKPVEIKQNIEKHGDDQFINDLKRKISLVDILKWTGVDTSRNPTQCPFHASSGGKCLGFNNDTAHCFHCEGSWNMFSLTMEHKKCTFKEALGFLASIAGMELEFEDSNRRYAESLKKQQESKIDYNEQTGRYEIDLPHDGVLISSFAQKLVNVLKKENTIFYRPDLKSIVEIEAIKDLSKKEYVGFSIIQSSRFITVAEKYFDPMVMAKEGKNWIKKKRSMGSELAKTLLASPQLQEGLPTIERIFKVPLPHLVDGKITFPKKGYDERFKSWLALDAPDISDENMSVEEAKETIGSLYKEFCFKEQQDLTNAIAALITPFLRGIFSSPTCRTPLFFYMANRERAGKDYCAGITGVLYEGIAIDQAPINSEEGSKSSNPEELRKKLVAAFINGVSRFHSSNNKGNLDSAVLEGILTTKFYQDRLLGKNEILTFPNEMDYSASGNVGVRFTPDLLNRMKIIRLFLEVEDANSRVFNNPDLHGYVKENRSKILSALYALIRNWIEKGMPAGSIPFSSFPEWAKVCGGVMEAAGYDNPCVPDKETFGIPLDGETQDMKRLFELVYERYAETWIDKTDIKDVITLDETIFTNLDFGQKSDQTKFGILLSKYVGRILSGIQLSINNIHATGSRQKYLFTKKNIEHRTNFVEQMKL